MKRKTEKDLAALRLFQRNLTLALTTKAELVERPQFRWVASKRSAIEECYLGQQLVGTVRTVSSTTYWGRVAAVGTPVKPGQDPRFLLEQDVCRALGWER